MSSEQGLDKQRDPDLEQETEVGVEVKVRNKVANEGGGEGENRGCRQGGPTKLPGKGGGHQHHPGMEEPLVEWRQEELEGLLYEVNSAAPPKWARG